MNNQKTKTKTNLKHDNLFLKVLFYIANVFFRTLELLMNSFATISKFNSSSWWTWSKEISFNRGWLMVDRIYVLSLRSAEKDLSDVHDDTGITNIMHNNFFNSGNIWLSASSFLISFKTSSAFLIGTFLDFATSKNISLCNFN